MWGAFAHVSGTARYRCSRCDVYGAGERCWLCGSKKKLDKHVAYAQALTGGAHHYDPAARSVWFPGGDVPIENVRIKSLVRPARSAARRKS